MSAWRRWQSAAALSAMILAFAGFGSAYAETTTVASLPASAPTKEAGENKAQPGMLISAAANPGDALNMASSFVQNLGDRAVTILADKGMDTTAKGGEFRQMLRDSFDLPTIGRFVIGRNWYTATPEQQQEYLRLFEKLVIQIYSDRFASYSGELFKVVSARPEGDRDFIVVSQIIHPDRPKPTEVNWRVRNFGTRMAIIDVMVEGVSMSVTQRQEYNAVIQRAGGDVQSLLNLMRDRLDATVPD